VKRIWKVERRSKDGDLELKYQKQLRLKIASTTERPTSGTCHTAPLFSALSKGETF
jgi:hypothetical protein